MPQIMEASKLSKLISVIGRASGKVDELIQSAAVGCIAQSIVHRNTTPANDLIERVNKHVKATLVTYLEKHGAFAWSRDEGKLLFLEREGVVWDDTYSKQVMAQHWTEARKPPQPKSVYDAPAEISSLIDRLRKKAVKGATIKGIEVLDAVEAAYNTANGAFMLKNMKADTNLIDKADADAKAFEERKVKQAQVQQTPTTTEAPATPEALAKLAKFFNGSEQALAKAA